MSSAVEMKQIISSGEIAVCIAVLIAIAFWPLWPEWPQSYDRDDWPRWADEDGDCLNTRHEILQERSRIPVTMIPDNGCRVLTGEWMDPYTGKTWTLASDVDIDHVVAIREAHVSGGDSWGQGTRQQFVNDRLNLIITEDGVNSAKGARGPAEWLPPAADYRCHYVTLWAMVKEKYDLIISPEDSRVILEQCQ
jgi:hypothetical protein